MKVNTRIAQRVLLGCVLVFCGAVTARAATENSGNATTGKWIASADGCQVYDDAWVPGETVKWSGACTGGRAEGSGKLTWSVNGEFVELVIGDLHDGKVQHARIVNAEGVVSEGDFVDGKLINKSASARSVQSSSQGDLSASSREDPRAYAASTAPKFDWGMNHCAPFGHDQKGYYFQNDCNEPVAVQYECTGSASGKTEAPGSIAAIQPGAKGYAPCYVPRGTSDYAVCPVHDGFVAHDGQHNWAPNTSFKCRRMR